MTNPYVKIEMQPTIHGVGGSFQTEASFGLDNVQAAFSGIEVKIDTGCSVSTIPLRRLQVSDMLCRTLKRADVKSGVPYLLSYGVETGGLKHKVPKTEAEKMDCPAMKFEHRITNFMIGGVKLSIDKIHLNYDRRGNVLIGMDILENWDIHIGISKLTGKNLFLACPLEYKNKEYIDALKQHFGC